MQESGVPNVSGNFSFHNYGISSIKTWIVNGSFSSFAIDGSMNRQNCSQTVRDWDHSGISINLSRSSSVYTNINEVRVKSLISIGFIKLY